VGAAAVTAAAVVLYQRKQRRDAERTDSGPPTLYDWQALAPAHADQPDDLSSDDLAQRTDDLMKEAFATLAESPAFNIELPPPDTILPPEADWSFFAHMLLSRVEEVNTLDGPRVRLVHWSTLDKLGRIPRWPDDAAHVLDAADLIRAWIARQDAKGKISGRILCLSMFSHRGGVQRCCLIACTSHSLLASAAPRSHGGARALHTLHALLLGGRQLHPAAPRASGRRRGRRGTTAAPEVRMACQCRPAHPKAVRLQEQ
jgi:hypothetical protein